MQLNMQGANGTPQNLPATDHVITTGPMGDCVSVIVLYHYDTANNRYQQARGWHGLGGVQVIDMAAMMAGVPNLTLTQVIVIPGTLQQSNHAREQNLAHVMAGLANHGNVNIRYVAGLSSANVHRNGQIT